MKFLFFSLIAIFAAGIACAGIMAGGRWIIEARYSSVCVMISYNDLLKLVGDDDIESCLFELNIGMIVLNSGQIKDGAVTERLKDFRLAVYSADPGDAAEPASLFIPASSSVFSQDALDGHIPLGRIENYSRMGDVLPPQIDTAVFPGPMARIFYLPQFDDMMIRQYSDSWGERAGNMMYRAATDRSIPVMWISPFYPDGEIVTDRQAYVEMLSLFSERLAMRGLTVGRDFTTQESWNPPGVLLVGAYVGLAAFALLLMMSALTVSTNVASGNKAARIAAGFLSTPKHVLGLLLISIVGVIAGHVFLREFFRQGMAFISAILFPCAAALLLHRLSRGGKGAPAQFAKMLAGCTAVCILGGIMVGGILAGGEYMLESRHFSGVKLSQAAPLCFAAFYFVVMEYRAEGKWIKFNARRFVLPIGALVILAGAGVYFLRLGDTLFVPSAETAARNWMENTIYIRPRSAEAFVALPSIALFAFSASKKARFPLPPLGFICTIGFVSIVNTFCHISASLEDSLIRTLLGIAIAAAIGFACIGVLCLILAIMKSMKAKSSNAVGF